MEVNIKRIGKRASTPGMFITFEGTEGSGKTTQCRHLADTLRSKGYQILQTREPGGTPLAEAIRNLLLSKPKTKTQMEPITPECETVLILAARSQHITHVIRPALDQGNIVLCDRFFDSTLAYQGFGRHVRPQILKSMNQFVTEGLSPHLTFLLDLPIQEGLARRQRTNNQNRLDQETLEFHERVHQGFLALAKHASKRIKKLDATQLPHELAKQIYSITVSRLKAPAAKHTIRSTSRSTR